MPNYDNVKIRYSLRPIT